MKPEMMTVRVVNFETSKNLIVKSTIFPHSDIQKHTWTSPDGVIHNEIDHVLIDKRQYSNILDVRYFRGAYCSTNNYMVMAKQRISVSKGGRQNFDLEKFDLKRLDDVEVKKSTR
jgi:hypothetical protein